MGGGSFGYGVVWCEWVLRAPPDGRPQETPLRVGTGLESGTTEGKVACRFSVAGVRGMCVSPRPTQPWVPVFTGKTKGGCGYGIGADWCEWVPRAPDGRRQETPLQEPCLTGTGAVSGYGVRGCITTVRFFAALRMTGMIVVPVDASTHGAWEGDRSAMEWFGVSGYPAPYPTMGSGFHRKDEERVWVRDRRGLV